MRITKARPVGVAKKYQRWTPEADIQILMLRRDGHTIREIAVLTQRTRIGILERLKLLRRVERLAVADVV